jgi:hypothetical protein
LTDTLVETVNPRAGKHAGPGIFFGVPPETASFGPGRRSRSFEILDVAQLRLRFRNRCGLGRNQNLPFLEEHHL